MSTSDGRFRRLVDVRTISCVGDFFGVVFCLGRLGIIRYDMLQRCVLQDKSLASRFLEHRRYGLVLGVDSQVLN